jgi:tetratricopeptide (TPR) repeat protein
MLLSIAANVDFTQSAADALALLLKPLLYLLTLLMGTMAAAMFSQHSWALDDRPAPWIWHCTVAGLGLFLLHNLIDFSLFETGALFLFMAVAGSALGAAPVDDRTALRRSVAVTAAVLGALVWLGAAIFLVTPILIAEQSAADANELIRTAPVSQNSAAISHFRQAADAFGAASLIVPYNSDYVYRQAETCLRFGDLEDATALIARAKQVNPLQPDAYLLEANLQLSRSNPDPGVVKGDFDVLLRLNPNDVSLHMQYGDALERLGLQAEACEQYTLALSADAALPSGEPKRLTPQQVADLQAKANGSQRVNPLRQVSH